MDTRYSFDPPRPLTERERTVTRWMIEHGDAPKEEKEGFLAQLATATVVRRCACGCASVDFAIRGEEAPKGVGLQMLGDFLCGDKKTGLNGVFVFARSGVLAGVEIYQLSDEKIHSELPGPESLRIIDGSDETISTVGRGRHNGGSVGLQHTVALVAAVVGAVGSVGLMFRASQHPPLILLVLFTIWVSLPFVALSWANIVSKRWLVATRVLLYCTTLIVTLGSLAIYGGLVDVKPAGSPNAFLWVVVPGASFIFVTIVVSTLGFIRRFRRRAGA